MRRVAVALVAVVAAACWAGDETPVSDLGDATPTGTIGAQLTVQLIDFQFAIPRPVGTGEELVILNSGDVPHTFTIEAAGIDTGPVPPREQTTVTAPEDPGTYELVCTIHATQMRTTLEVRP